MLQLLASVPWFVPVLAVSLGVSVVLSGRVAKWQRMSRPAAVLLLAGLGLIVSATLTPQAAAVHSGATSGGQCDMSRVAFASVAEYLSGNEVGGNVLMFLPLGVAIGLASGSRSRRTLALASIVLPFAIEAVQLLVPGLDRACESRDVIDNLLGLTIGLVVGAVLDAAVRRRHGEAQPGPRQPANP